MILQEKPRRGGIILENVTPSGFFLQILHLTALAIILSPLRGWARANLIYCKKTLKLQH